MTPERLRQLLDEISRGLTTPHEALERLAHLPFEDVGFARVDHHRALRCGLPEVILGQGKTPRQTAAIFARLAASGSNVLATRVGPRAARLVREQFPAASYDQLSRTLALRQVDPGAHVGSIAVVCAGTADLKVAEEARVTAEILDQHVVRVYDAGVAGLQRLLPEIPRLRESNAIVVVAGMEGALPSVVGGLVDVPVIAVPTSVGYGASFGGLAALLGMLNSCAAGVSTVNIDNGFAAGYQAALISRRIAMAGKPWAAAVPHSTNSL
jgi:NCAIR mutase (PurE)-related protein